MMTKFLPLGWWQSPTVLLSSQQIFQAWNHRVVRTWKHWKSSSSDYFSAIIVIKIIKCHNNNQYFDDLRSMVELLWRMITINNMIFWNQHKTIKVFKIKTKSLSSSALCHLRSRVELLWRPASKNRGTGDERFAISTPSCKFHLDFL